MRRAVSLLMTGLLLLAACRREGQQASQTRTFYSAALFRKVTYRIIVPAHLPPGPVSVLYLLHGAGGSADDWANHSDIASLLPDSVLVMPFGANSYFMNSATHPEDRYEDFITRDLIADAERSLPARPRRRAIAGVSMGGCAAIVLALRHAELFPFAAGLSRSTCATSTGRPAAPSGPRKIHSNLQPPSLRKPLRTSSSAPARNRWRNPFSASSISYNDMPFPMSSTSSPAAMDGHNGTRSCPPWYTLCTRSSRRPRLRK